MKFTCAKNELKDALLVVNRAVAVKPQTPILAGIYLKAEGSTLEMQANNFSLGIITKIPVNTEDSGEIVVIFSGNCRETSRRNCHNFLHRK